MERSCVTTKGQVLIPKRLREKYGIKPGVRVALEETKDGLIIHAMDKDYFEQLAGSLKDVLPSTDEFMQWKKEEKSAEEQKYNNLVGKKK